MKGCLVISEYVHPWTPKTRIGVLLASTVKGKNEPKKRKERGKRSGSDLSHILPKQQ